MPCSSSAWGTKATNSPSIWPRSALRRPDGVEYAFEIDAFRKHCLLNGLDDIGLTLQDADAIGRFEQGHRAQQPWLFGALQ